MNQIIIVFDLSLDQLLKQSSDINFSAADKSDVLIKTQRCSYYHICINIPWYTHRHKMHHFYQ